MQALVDFFTNFYIVSAASAWLIAQVIKVFTGVFKLQEFTLRNMFFGTGGMPSSHTAAACALCAACVLKDGLAASSVAISGVLAMIVMIDAAGVRNETGKQSKALNMIISEMFSDSKHADLHFKELIGHSPLQILCGAITGIATAALLYLLPVFSA